MSPPFPFFLNGSSGPTEFRDVARLQVNRNLMFVHVLYLRYYITYMLLEQLRFRAAGVLFL